MSLNTPEDQVDRLQEIQEKHLYSLNVKVVGFISMVLLTVTGICQMNGNPSSTTESSFLGFIKKSSTSTKRAGFLGFEEKTAQHFQEGDSDRFEDRW